MVAFGGSIGNSEHADDLVLGTPNRLLRPDATEAELDLIEAEAAEAEAEADEEDDEAWYMGGEEAAADNSGETGEEATAVHPMAGGGRGGDGRCADRAHLRQAQQAQEKGQEARWRRRRPAARQG